MNAQLTPEQILAERTALITKWDAAETAKVAAIELEASLRLQLAENAFKYNETELPKGTKRLNVGFGKQLVGVFKINQKVEQDEVPNAISALVKEGMDKDSAANVFKTKYSVNASAFKALSQPKKDIVLSIVSESSGMPAIKLETAKAKKK